jgi:hypothetical protein
MVVVDFEPGFEADFGDFVADFGDFVGCIVGFADFEDFVDYVDSVNFVESADFDDFAGSADFVDFAVVANLNLLADVLEVLYCAPEEFDLVPAST